ncbi:MAG TPA: T3SS effector HopA1 family protein [Bryobacteraceae bacterium]|nr:T3SS effector HopA1 family protein [Bryobacteraceae bacterium]
MNSAAALRKELGRVIDAVAILSPASFTFAGHPSTGLAMPMMGLQMAPGTPPLMNELISQLYQHCFSNRFKGEIAKSEMPRPDIDAQWMETLSRANQSRERWEDGWKVAHGMPNGQVVAIRGATTRILGPGEFVNLSGSGMFLSPESAIRVYLPRESRTMQQGYYFVFGETPADSASEFSVVRFYWNVPAEAAAQLLELISVALNRWQVPFRFKTGASRALFARSDSAVLYSPRRYAQITYELVSEIHQRMRTHLRADVPLFTLRLGKGLAFAEDPSTQESFGLSRCRILAQGIWLAHQQGARQSQERLGIVEQQFRSEGISIDRPWLNAGSADEFAFDAIDREAA